MEKKHFLLVHGACHGAWCWYKVASLLKLAGHKVAALDMAASGINPKQANDIRSISDYSEPLMEFLMTIPEQEKVILVGHSIGGLTLSLAMERFPEKISAAVFVAAFLPGPELSFFTIKQEIEKDEPNDFYMDTKHGFDDGPLNPPTSFLFGPECLSTRLYQLSPNEDLVLATLCLRPFPYRDVDIGGTQDVGMVITKEKYGSVPRIYIVCNEDKILTEYKQRWMIRNNPPDEVKVINGSDHMPMFSKPQELCSCLQEIANTYI